MPSLNKPGSTFFVLDGVKSHFDTTIVNAAENHGTTIFWLTSNTKN